MPRSRGQPGPGRPWRRRATLALLPALLAAPALAQPPRWPQRPITLVNPFAPGGSTDLTARAVAELLGEALGVPVVVENRPGGGTSIAATMVAGAKPDGYTLLAGSPSLAINPALQPGLTPRDPQRELAPIGTTYASAYVLVVGSALPIHDLDGLLAAAKAEPGAMNFASSGIGATNHLALELFCHLAGVEITHIPYRGAAPALLDLRSGRVQGMFAGATEIGALVREGVLRPLAVTSLQPVPQFPEVPTIAARLPGFDVTVWQGIFAPAATPPEVLAVLEAALLRVTRGETLSARLREQGVRVTPGGAGDLRRLLAEETARWGQVIRTAGIRLEQP
ncbi:tripartite tricarboxylate transporter substrate binding protein [Roseomonas sp. 18066]|uniref:Bug family tripartite tricarboxylate transporter substrate binding protein n=1 Tax=Roseomonas sp. 18066 TaxID=2681412 RepID=UPI001357B560|nr:tripartite tricarboxylate transporter substrate binding protein [Roseomonas sp. 18066]